MDERPLDLEFGDHLIQTLGQPGKLLGAGLNPITLKRRHDFVGLDWLQSPLYHECIEAIKEITKTSFAYNEKNHCITVDAADVKRITGITIG